MAAPWPALGEWLTVERALWGSLLLLAAALRLWDLGGEPLQAAEAAKALASWKMVQGEGGNALVGPLLGYGNALIFLAFGDNDASARLLPALAGTATVGLPFLLRAALGRWGALVAAALLAISPTLLYLSRAVDGQALATAAGLAAAATLVRVKPGAQAGRYYAAAVAVGLLALSGRDAYTMLAVLAAAAAARLKGTGWGKAAPQGPTLRRAALLAGAVVVLGTTGLLANLRGVQEGLVAPLEAWLAALGGAGQDWHFQLQILVVYEPALLVFGLLGGIVALRERNGVGRFLVTWAAIALILSSLSGERPGAGIALALVPMALLAGPAIVGLVAGLRAAVSWQELAIYLAATLSLLALFWLATQFFTLPGQVLPETVRLGPYAVSLRTAGDVLIPAQATLMVVALMGLGVWIGARHVPKLVGALALVVLVTVTFHSATLLGYAANATPAELPVAARATPDVRVLASDVSDIVDALAVHEQARRVRVAVPEEGGARWLLRWYLRKQRGLGFGERPMADEGLVIAAADAEPPAGKFAAQRYRLQGSWTSGAKSAGSLWRWLTLREAPGPVRYEDVVLYVKAP